jgi:hypothetical protein
MQYLTPQGEKDAQTFSRQTVEALTQKWKRITILLGIYLHTAGVPFFTIM